MSKRIPKISIHPSLWIFALLSFLSGQFSSFFLLFFYICLHEIGHVLAAWLLGWKIEKVALLPFGGQMQARGILDREILEEAVVTLSGPFVNVLIIAILSTFFQDWSGFQESIKMNLQLLVFNLLPIWPLDGGRLVYLFAASFLPFKKANLWVCRISLFGIALLFLMILQQSFQLQWVLLLGYTLFCCLDHLKNLPVIEQQFFLERWKSDQGRGKMIPEIVKQELTVKDLVKKLKKGKRQTFILTWNGNIRKLNDTEIAMIYFRLPPS
ncbi:site-2 protease family protein [Jeotgalibacillus aurantiacus]|uniref:site-2 protease family protein n=1 Tax=Jeotgalibacillus aurantiacus TaxID=2763266 RepID=UPI001D0A7EDB|nr:site-2 protease family protein [Jeotgalibacillus aurantiacus]